MAFCFAPGLIWYTDVGSCLQMIYKSTIFKNRMTNCIVKCILIATKKAIAIVWLGITHSVMTFKQSSPTCLHFCCIKRDKEGYPDDNNLITPFFSFLVFLCSTVLLYISLFWFSIFLVFSFLPSFNCNHCSLGIFALFFVM